jgi:DNA-binding NarL/FixJ family response regulator
MARVRVLLADNHPPLLAAVRRLLAPDFDVVGEASDGAEAVRLASALHPDVMVIDLAMPRMGGIEAIRQVSRAQSSQAIVALSVLSDPAVLAAALDAGARGYVLKSQAGTELIPAIRAALAGEARVPLRPSLQNRSPQDFDRDNTA